VFDYKIIYFCLFSVFSNIQYCTYQKLHLPVKFFEPVAKSQVFSTVLSHVGTLLIYIHIDWGRGMPLGPTPIYQGQCTW